MTDEKKTGLFTLPAIPKDRNYSQIEKIVYAVSAAFDSTIPGIADIKAAQCDAVSNLIPNAPRSAQCDSARDHRSK